MFLQFYIFSLYLLRNSEVFSQLIIDNGLLSKYMENNNKLNIVILDDHKMLSKLLKESLSRTEFAATITVFSEAAHFFTFLEYNKVDLLIVDVYMPKMNGLDVVKRCRERYSVENLKIIMLSSSIEHKVIVDAVSLGANAYVTKEDKPEELFSAIHYVFSEKQKPFFSVNTKEVFLSATLEDAQLVKLSPREDQLLRLICDAKTPKEIAFELNLSINTIHFYTKRLMAKMKVNRTPDLILKAINKGFVLSPAESASISGF